MLTCAGNNFSPFQYMIEHLNGYRNKKSVRTQLEKDEVISSYGDRLLTYSRIKYDNRVTVSEVDGIGFSLLKYTFPVDDGKFADTLGGAVTIEQLFRWKEQEKPDIWYIVAYIGYRK